MREEEGERKKVERECEEGGESKGRRENVRRKERERRWRENVRREGGYGKGGCGGGATLNGSNESANSMIRQPSLFVKNTKSSRFVSLFLRGRGGRRMEKGEEGGGNMATHTPDDSVHAFHL